jgi:hypothetical protein
MFLNKQFSILKFPIIFVAMLPKFFYSHTFKSQVLQWLLGFIILKIIIKFLQCGLRIFAGFIHNDIVLLWSIWWILKRMASVRRRLWRMNMCRRIMLRRMMLKRLCRWWIFRRRGSLWRILEKRGSVMRRLWRMTMWRRMVLNRLCRWWIFRRRDNLCRILKGGGGSVRWRLWRMTMWRRTMLRRMMLKRLCRWWIFWRRGSLWRILRWRSKSGSSVYGILRSWNTIILSALR